MSRYAVNALMREVLITDQALADFRADPAAYVSAWSRRQLAAGSGVTLEAAESTALAARDYGTLYERGAHPYLLWSFTEAVWVPEVPRADLVADYKARAGRVDGFPDCRTVPSPDVRYGILDTKAGDEQPRTEEGNQ